MKKKIFVPLIVISAIVIGILGTFGLRGASAEQMKRFEMVPNDHPANTRALRGAEYQEYFIVYRRFFDLKAVIYNNVQAGPIPDNEWDAVDLKQIKKDLGAFRIVKNGPRFWTLDGIYGYELGERRNFLGYDFDVVAVLDVGLADLLGRDIYVERSVERYTDWRFNAGEKAYILTSDTGEQYVMQSASREIDRNMKLEGLDTLGSRLTLPEGWTYEVKVLDEDLVLETRGYVYILQDNLQNTYQKM